MPETSNKNPDISIVKTSSKPAGSNNKVDYKVVVTNAKKAGPLYGARLTDTLYKPSGEVMYNRAWELGALAPGDQIVLTYTVEFGASTTPGTYKNVAKVTGLRLAATEKDGGKAITPVEGSRTITFTEDEDGLVLGAETSTTSGLSCALVPSASLARGSSLISEVTKLQQFLNTEVGANLPTTGYFGPLTEAAVKTFQLKYQSEILAPVGLTYATGGVYSSTLNKIRQLACGGTATVPVPVVYTPPLQVAASAAYTPPAPVAKVAVPPPPAPTAPAAPIAPSEPPATSSSDGILGWFTGLFK